MDASAAVVVTIVVAIAFDIINGFHDAANSIATLVSTRVLTPRAAVLWAAVFNFVALLFFGEGVAKTIAGFIKVGFADPAFVYVVMCGLIGAIIWNLMTWWWGLPSSSSHALLGGLGGAGVTHAGFGVLVMSKVKLTVMFIFLAPLIGFFLGGLVMLIIYWICRRMRPRKVDTAFKGLQLISAAAQSIGHGGNDSQKTMGIIMAVMVAGGLLGEHESAPTWVIFASYGAMAFGTAIGGWKIVKTMGMGITELKPAGGFAAQVAGAATLFTSTYLKVPVSTTHTITGSIVGVGSTTKVRGIRWGVAGRIVWAWIFTIPAAAVFGAGTFAIVRLFHPW